LGEKKTQTGWNKAKESGNTGRGDKAKGKGALKNTGINKLKKSVSFYTTFYKPSEKAHLKQEGKKGIRTIKDIQQALHVTELGEGLREKKNSSRKTDQLSHNQAHQKHVGGPDLRQKPKHCNDAIQN